MAMTELAFLLPVLLLMFVIGADFARIYHYSVVLENCARAGALWATDPSTSSYATSATGITSPYTTVTQAALAEAPNLTPAPTVTSSTSGGYVTVTVTWTFKTITQYAGVPSSVNLSRSVQMKIPPVTPN
jgi:Flp pilus assembly protein TadG